MRLLYISCHSVLERSELQMFTELGIDVFSYAGAYTNPEGHSSLHRPGIKGLKYYPELEKLSREYPRTNLPKEVVDQFDVIMVMGGITNHAIVQNWPNIKHKKVIWRTIGQNLPHDERMMKPLRDEGLKIIRYSPKEEQIRDFIGSDALIRFYEDVNDLGQWTGNNKQVINITQTLKGRAQFCHYEHIVQLMSGFDAKVFGTGNDDLGSLNGGQISYELLKGQLRDNRVFIYGGTFPASYTLSFVEAWMTGIPIVALGPGLWANGLEGADGVYEVSDLIVNGETGFIGDNIQELRGYIRQLLDNNDLAFKISKRARAKALEIFGKNKITQLWKDFFDKLMKGKI